MAVNIHITIIELNALHTKRQNLFQELDAVIHLLMEDRKSGSAGMPRPISYAVFCLKKKKTRRTRKVIMLYIADGIGGTCYYFLYSCYKASYAERPNVGVREGRPCY